MKVLVVIVCYRVPDLTIACLRSLSSEIPTVPGTEVAICENGTGGDSAEQIARAIDQAQTSGLRALYLLTETAEGFFPRFGFTREPRENAPAAIQASTEYCSVCGPAAVAMVLRLKRGDA